MPKRPSLKLLSRVPTPEQVSGSVNNIIRWLYSIGPTLESLDDVLTIRDLVNTGLFSLSNGKLVPSFDNENFVTHIRFTQAHLDASGFFYHEHGLGDVEFLCQVYDNNKEQVSTSIVTNSRYIIVDLSWYGGITGTFTLVYSKTL